MNLLSRLSPRAKKLFAGGVVGVVVGAVAGFVAYTRPLAFERGEFWTYDQRAREGARPEDAAQDVVVIDIGDDDIKDVKRNIDLAWPWPRELHGAIASYASKAGAKAVIFDFIYQDPSIRGASDDETFADAMREHGRTVFGLVLTRTPIPSNRETGTWVAELPTPFKTRKEAEVAAIKLLNWGVRAFVVGPELGPVRVLYGGVENADEVLERWGAMSNGENPDSATVAPLFASTPPPDAKQDDPLPAPVEPKPRELGAEETTAELTVESMIAARDGLDVKVPPHIQLPEKNGIDPPLDALVPAAGRLGGVFQDNEADGLMRRHAFLAEFDGKLYPSLALAAYLIAHPGVKPAFEGNELVLGKRRVPIDSDGKMVIRYHGPGRIYKHVGAYSVLQSMQLLEENKPPVVPPETFRNKYVFVSATAAALRDIRVTPVSRLHLGAEIHANVLDNLEHGNFVWRAPRWLDAGIAFFLSLALALLVVLTFYAISNSVLGFLATTATTGAVIGGYWLLAGWLYDSNGIWLAVATPAIGALTSTFASLLVTSSIERRGRRFVQEALGRYTSAELVKELMAHPEHLSLEWGERREMSVYFSDIQGFTSISEAMEPEDLVALLNDYLTHMTDIVLEHGGVVDKYIGDAVMAFWGAPLANKTHAEQAIRCAIAMRKRCDELRPKWLKDFGHTVMARAGVNSGIAVVGNMGSKHKYNYTVMGDMVNLASRLEGANKPYGTYLMISEFCYEKVHHIVDSRELDLMTVKGKEKGVKVYEVFDEAGKTDPTVMQAIEIYEEGLLLYRAAKFEAAMDAFERALKIRPTDGPSKMYIERCQHFIEEPPPPDWDGVWHMKEK